MRCVSWSEKENHIFYSEKNQCTREMLSSIYVFHTDSHVHTINSVRATSDENVMVDIFIAQRQTLVDEIGCNETAPGELNTAGIHVISLEAIYRIRTANR